ncbi:MAG: hypothetical protein ABIK28_14675, partial [Planctomycetota bacterium]
METYIDLSLSGYGKLPLSREFLLLDCRKGPPLIFQYFIDKAAPWILKSKQGGAPIKICTILPRVHRMLFASIWSSKDEGGMRAYPFSYFTEMEKQGFPADPPGFWTRFQPIYADLERLYQGSHPLTNREELERYLALDNKKVAAPLGERDAQERFQREASAISVNDWAAGAFGETMEAFTVGLWRL